MVTGSHNNNITNDNRTTYASTHTDDLDVANLNTDDFNTDEFAEVMSETLFNSFDTGYYIGMMSGTSLDGLDAVICQFDENTSSEGHGKCDDGNEHVSQNTTTNRLVASYSQDFPKKLRQVLLALCQPNGVTKLSKVGEKLALEHTPQSELEWFGWASREYAEFASKLINEMLAKANIEPDAILAIGCHGQTVRHCPQLSFSLQLVDANIIAERTGISVVSDFRRRDMAVGGQGAPLAPAFHLAHFGKKPSNIENSEPTKKPKHRIVVNLGGIANITVLPAGRPEQVVGYDTGPANILLDGWYQHHVESLSKNSAQTFEPLYDKDGAWANSGNLNPALLTQLLSHPYFTEPTPKSTGREAFNLAWLNEQINKAGLTLEQVNPADIQATLTTFTVVSLSNAIKREIERLSMPSGDIIVCGGGAYNPNILSQLADALPNWAVHSSADFGIAPTWVESMAFAWLARQTIMGEAGNLPAVTGASKPVVLGQVCFA